MFVCQRDHNHFDNLTITRAGVKSVIEAFEQLSIDHVPQARNQEAEALPHGRDKPNRNRSKELKIEIKQEPAYAYKP